MVCLAGSIALAKNINCARQDGRVCVGTNKGDCITGTNKSERIRTLGGNDTVLARGGKDKVSGGD